MEPPGERYYLSETIIDKARRLMGWCPNGVVRNTRGLACAELDLTVRNPVPSGPAAPTPAATAAPAEHRTEYQTNLLLILVFLGGLFYAAGQNLLVPFGILSAVLVYFNAENIHAGRKFKEVALLGEVASWQPIVWAVAVLIGNVILFGLYLCCRQEIYDANN